MPPRCTFSILNRTTKNLHMSFFLSRACCRYHPASCGYSHVRPSNQQAFGIRPHDTNSPRLRILFSNFRKKGRGVVPRLVQIRTGEYNTLPPPRLKKNELIFFLHAPRVSSIARGTPRSLLRVGDESSVASRRNGLAFFAKSAPSLLAVGASLGCACEMVKREGGSVGPRMGGSSWGAKVQYSVQFAVS